ncbi:MAG: response regulator transcription factor [Bacillota bacterium]|nr:response regulator transcription factor [Desulfurispora thermophila]
MEERDRPRILVVEDEPDLARFLQLELNHAGYQAATAANGYEALGRMAEEWDLIILDLMLPGLDGLEVCRRIRQTSVVPVIMLTARDSVADKVCGLDSGADDYLTKPFAVEELLARVRARLRSVGTARQSGEKIVVGDLVVCPGTRMVWREGQLIQLSRREFDLLVYLAENSGIVLSRETILSRVWGYDYYGSTNIVDVYVRYLRAKIDEPFARRLLHTVRGVGYTLREEI